MEIAGLAERVSDQETNGSDNVAEAVELTQELLRSGGVPVNTVPSSEIPVTAGGDTTGFAAELDNAKGRIAELESVETTNVR